MLYLICYEMVIMLNSSKVDTKKLLEELIMASKFIVL